MTSANPHAHGRIPAPDNDGPVYWECGTCGFLSHDPGFADAARKCPACDSTAGARRVFPPDRLRRVDARIRRYNVDGESEVVVILVATFLESLLEDMLARIMTAEGASLKLSAAVLDTLRSVGQRIGKLFPTLTGAERNAFIHDAAFEGAREELGEASAEEALCLLDQGYKLFVRINNRFVAGAKYRRKDDSRP